MEKFILKTIFFFHIQAVKDCHVHSPVPHWQFRSFSFFRSWADCHGAIAHIKCSESACFVNSTDCLCQLPWWGKTALIGHYTKACTTRYQTSHHQSNDTITLCAENKGPPKLHTSDCPKCIIAKARKSANLHILGDVRSGHLDGSVSATSAPWPSWNRVSRWQLTGNIFWSLMFQAVEPCFHHIPGVSVTYGCLTGGFVPFALNFNHQPVENVTWLT